MVQTRIQSILNYYAYDEVMAAFFTTMDHVVLEIKGYQIAIPWEDLESILMKLGEERGRLKRAAEQEDGISQ